MTERTTGQRMPHPHRVSIGPVPSGTPRPLWSVMIPHFNSAHYLKQTIESVLAQDPGADAMQIEVVDDHSTRDDPESVVRAVGRGRVTLHRQPQNVGHIRNFATCLARSRGTLVHLLHGDDYVLPGFYRAMGVAFARAPEAGLATCRHRYVVGESKVFGTSALLREAAGLLDNAYTALAVRGNLQTPSVVVRRECYETLGGFDDRLVCAEDYEMWARIASMYPVWYEPETLAAYRFNSDSNSSRNVGGNVRYMRNVVDIISTELPPPAPAGWQREVHERMARVGLDEFATFLSQGRIGASLTLIQESLRSNSGATTLGYTLGASLRGLRLGVRRLIRAD